MLDGITCIIADDAPLYRDRNHAVAKKYGMVVLGAFDNGTDAVFAAKASKPQVAFLDIVMKGMTGIEAAALIRRAVPECKIVLVTASSQDAILKNASAGVFDELLVKPYPDERLLEKVAKAMGMFE